MSSGARSSLLGLVAIIFLAGSARAQAWLPPKGEAFFSINYGNFFTTKHYLGRGTDPGDNKETDRGHIRGQSVGFDLGYALIDRLVISFGIPYMDTKYMGTEPHKELDGRTVPVDDGEYHGTFQDYRIDLRYQAVSGPMVVTPFVAAVIPSHSYTFFAHSAAGRDLHEYLVGVSSGGRLDRILPGGYVQVKYSYAFVERVLGIKHDRSDAELELGYFLASSLGVRAVGTWSYTHGGVVFRSGKDITDTLNPYHDQISHASALIAGGGLSYALSGSVDVSATYLRSLGGRGGHKIDQALSFGLGWNFSPQQLARRVFARKPHMGPEVQ